jgi:UDP-N-acetylglucosamine--dolichyl-phosphate N-acetylglucosaminephosphotransferase
VVIIGVFDDLISIRQWIKAIIPVFAALPLMALKEGYSMMRIPFVGLIEFGIFYPLVLVPLGVTGAANAVNMLAGFNGLEVGMGVVAVGVLAVIAYLIGETTALIILLAALGALMAALYYNWYPAKVLVGDVGTLTIGAVVASAVIVGNYETAGVIIIIPYVIDFLIKAKNRFPYSFGIYREGKLYCPDSGPVGLAQLIMKVSGGISERNLVLVLMGIEAIFGAIAILLYV